MNELAFEKRIQKGKLKKLSGNWNLLTGVG
jgi:hypothetical protein